MALSGFNPINYIKELSKRYLSMMLQLWFLSVSLTCRTFGDFLLLLNQLRLKPLPAAATEQMKSRSLSKKHQCPRSYLHLVLIWSPVHISLMERLYSCVFAYVVFQSSEERLSGKRKREKKRAVIDSGTVPSTSNLNSCYFFHGLIIDHFL